MRPRDTRYRLAATARDYSRAHALAKRHGLDGGVYTWPTVLAERGHRLVGCLATSASDRAIIAGPLAVESPRPLLLAVRLIDSYEGVLRAAGVTRYLFHISVENKGWRALVRKALPDLRPYATTDGEDWFMRVLS